MTNDKDALFARQSSVNKRITIMKNSKIATAAVMLCTLSFGALAADPLPQPGNTDHTQIGIAKATDVEAGSN
ncbi:hypothetical protein GP886_24045, partial [Escherichia coli]|nr:hypothetical protein [Escherichia coli]